MRLGDLVSVTKGKKPLSVVDRSAPGNVRLIQIEDLRDGATPRFTPSEPGQVVATPNDVVLAWDGANAGTVGYGLSGAVGSTLAVLRPRDPEALRTGFLGHYLRSQQTFLRARCKGATVPHIDGQVLADLRIPLLSAKQQDLWVARLESAESAKRASVAQAELIGSLAESVFLDMFGGWNGPVQTVASVAADRPGAIRTGPFGSQLLHSEFTSTGIAVLGIDNVVENRFRWRERRYITEDKYQQLKRYTVHPGDVLITIMGTCGRCVVVPEGIPTAINTKHLCAITVNQSLVLPEFVRACFLWHPLSRNHLLQRVKGSIMDGLNMGIIKEMPIPVPPVADQGRFVEFLSEIDQTTKLREEATGLYAELYGSLQSMAFARAAGDSGRSPKGTDGFST